MSNPFPFNPRSWFWSQNVRQDLNFSRRLDARRSHVRVTSNRPSNNRIKSYRKQKYITSKPVTIDTSQTPQTKALGLLIIDHDQKWSLDWSGVVKSCLDLFFTSKKIRNVENSHSTAIETYHDSQQSPNDVTTNMSCVI